MAVHLIASEHVIAAGREVAGVKTPEAAVRALLEGPVGEIELSLDFTSASDGAHIREVSISIRMRF